MPRETLVIIVLSAIIVMFGIVGAIISEAHLPAAQPHRSGPEYTPIGPEYARVHDPNTG